ncbi:hypothetical protein V5D56_00035 (plasmid) [Cellulosimicrobium sp. PMB13]|uniref:type IV secretory system conjugative DNA transfer family protein n=1 Tax=Cellulosimicrobium sp. PMB13 TaxID=3120158 RepID=UPI003F4C3B10
MSTMQTGQGQGYEQPQSDPWGDTLGAVVKAVAILALAVVVLPLVVPALALQVAHWYGPTKARYWIVPRWWVPAAAAGVAVVVVVLGWEVWQLVAWATSPAAAEHFAGGFSQWWPATWRAALPWLVLNLALGVLLIPAAWSWSRRRVARKVYMRQIDDVVRQEQIERARVTAEDWTAAKRAGVRMDPRTGTFARRRRRPRLTGPREVRAGAWALGLVTRPTVRTWRERTMDRRNAPDWTDAAGRWLVMPAVASAVRALLIAESGTGKTVLLGLIIRAAAAMGWPVVMIDAKGDPGDARELARVLGASGRTVAVGPKWNLFSGTPEQITEKLMRLLPPGEGAARHYSDEARGILGMIQAHEPLRSIEDLAERLRNPAPHVRDKHDQDQVEAIVDSRTKATAASRVAKSLAVALRPLAPYLAADGWTYEKPGAHVVVMPLTPVDTAQARLGDLMLMDLRQYMADRLRRGNKRPALLIVDEFPQLVTEDTDPGDVAAALFETARSAGLGLILAGQSVAGLSGDEAMRQRALSSGAGLIVGRSKDPEAVVQLAGTVMRMEASGEAHSGELRSGRAQHTYVIPPQVVREAWDGRFWLIHRGAIAPFRVLPPAPAGDQVAAEDQAQSPADAPAPAGTIDAAPAVVDELHDAAPEAAAVEALAEAGETSTPGEAGDSETSTPGDPYAGLVYEPSDDDAPPVDEAPPVDVDEPAARPEREPEPAAAVPAPRPAPRGFSATRRPTTKQGG